MTGRQRQDFGQTCRPWLTRRSKIVHVERLHSILNGEIDGLQEWPKNYWSKPLGLRPSVDNNMLRTIFRRFKPLISRHFRHQLRQQVQRCRSPSLLDSPSLIDVLLQVRDGVIFRQTLCRDAEKCAERRQIRDRLRRFFSRPKDNGYRTRFFLWTDRQRRFRVVRRSA